MLLIALLCAGCSTLLTMNSGVPYSGVQCNIGGIRKTFDSSTPEYLMPHWAEGIFSTIDLPLSAVGDTVILPYALMKNDRSHGVETPQFRKKRIFNGSPAGGELTSPCPSCVSTAGPGRL